MIPIMLVNFLLEVEDLVVEIIDLRLQGLNLRKNFVADTSPATSRSPRACASRAPIASRRAA